MTNKFEIGTCPACGKKCYRSRKEAKQAARNYHPGAKLSAYPCPAHPDFWHYGHLPKAVTKGRRSRDQIAAPKPRRSPYTPEKKEIR